VALVEDRAVASVTISRVSVEYCRWAKPAEQQLIDERRGRESQAIQPISTSAFQHFVLAELLTG
jgi:hypothetical protein